MDDLFVWPEDVSTSSIDRLKYLMLRNHMYQLSNWLSLQPERDDLCAVFFIDDEDEFIRWSVYDAPFHVHLCEDYDGISNSHRSKLALDRYGLPDKILKQCYFYDANDLMLAKLRWG